MSGGALLTAVFSSSCCWLPLLLVAFGASTASVGSYVEAYRPYLLVASVLLLGAAFYTAYFRKAPCDGSSECPTPNPKIVRLNKTLLWFATVFVLGFAFFPNYVGKILGTADSESISIDRTGLTEFIVEVKGMTCEACAVHTQTSLNGIHGVKSAIVNYDEKRATILGDSRVNENLIHHAIKSAGYNAERIDISDENHETTNTEDSP